MFGTRSTKIAFLFNTRNHNVCKSQELPQIKHLHLFHCHLLKKMKLKFPTIDYSFKTDQALLHTHPKD